jgi:hypothetical protein
MTYKSFIVLCFVVFFGVLFLSLVILFGPNDERSPSESRPVVFKNKPFLWHNPQSDPFQCFDRLFNQLQSGSLGFDRLQQGIEDCTKQNFAYGGNSIIPDQPLQGGQELRYA